MKIKVLKSFKDLKENRQVEVGEEYIISKKRFEEMQEKQSKTEYVYVEEVKEDK